MHVRRKYKRSLGARVSMVGGVILVSTFLSAFSGYFRKEEPASSLGNARSLSTTTNSTLPTNEDDSDFPDDAFSMEQKENGAVVLHFIGMIYMFIGLAIVCDDYFVSALEVICERWDISDDVAGATFMAAGGSAPELFTSIIGTFVAKSDVGFSTIVGSAVFNVLFVIGICAAFAGQVLELTWYPLTRDSICYTINLLVLVLVIYDQEVQWWEALIMFVMYLGYVVIMKYNEHIKEWAMSKTGQRGNKKVSDSSTIGSGTEDDSKEESENTVTKTVEISNAVEDAHVVTVQQPASPNKVRLSPLASVDDVSKAGEAESTELVAVTDVEAGRSDDDAQIENLDTEPLHADEAEPVHVGDDSKRGVAEADAGATGKDAEANSGNEKAEQDNDEEDDESFDPEWPEGWKAQLYFVFTAPLVYLMWFTIPDCRKPELRKWFMVTFFLGIFYIGAFTYVMVWMADEISRTIGIPEPVMGVTILAGGTSIPDALSSLIVARNGYGDMAVSSSIGSNIFDITVGLPIPWMLYHLVAQWDDSRPTPVMIYSDTLYISVATLLLMLIATVVSIHLFGWKLNWKLGVACVLLYFVFVAEALILEM